MQQSECRRADAFEECQTAKDESFPASIFLFHAETFTCFLISALLLLRHLHCLTESDDCVCLAHLSADYTNDYTQRKFTQSAMYTQHQMFLLKRI